MTYKGHVRNGAILLDDPVCLPEGSLVLVQEITDSKRHLDEEPKVSLYEALKPFIGVAEELPEDMALNHDHYLHGLSRK